MKKVYTLTFAIFLVSLISFGQKKTYTTTGGEIIFSFADIKLNGLDVSNTIRFSPFFNIQTQVHRDLTDKFGLLTGFNLRNVGFIYDDPYVKGTYYKVRNYTIGIPLGIKFGNMDGKYIFAGYELEMPFNYKEKTFVYDEKSKFDEWFSNRTPTFYSSLFLGVNLVEGAQIKFKYYLTNWFNKDFTTLDSTGATTQPYKDFNVNVFYVALSFQFLKGTSFYYKD